MRAWQFVQIGRALELVDLPEPVPGERDVIVEVQASGLCHSDVGFMDGTITSLLGKRPIVLGHEIVGTVSAVGSGVELFRQGDRVAVPATTDGPFIRRSAQWSRCSRGRR